MLDEIKLSIIIPVYNMEEYIEDCLMSVFNQKTSCTYEVIIINDGSTDKSLVLIDSLLKSKPDNCKVKLLSIDNNGLSFARNLGIKNSSGQYISFLDSDDWVCDFYVNNIVMEISSSTDVEIFYFDRIFSYENKTVKVSYPKFAGVILEQVGLFDKLNLSVCNKAFSSKLFSNNFKFPIGRIYEDIVFGFDALFLAKKIKKVDGYLYFVRQDTPNSITNKLNDKELDMLWSFEYCDGKIENLSLSIRTEYSSFKSKTLAYWAVKLARNNALSLLGDKKIPHLSLSNFNSINEKVLAFLINAKLYKLLSLAIKLNDFLKK